MQLDLYFIEGCEQFTVDESRELEHSLTGENEVEFPIVGIGASAGGLDPIRKLLEDLPIDTGMSFIVIQHLAAGQESMLPEILSRSTKMNVLQVKNGLKVEKNHVYVIAPGTTVTLKDSYLQVVPKGLALKPINDFMISLATERKTLAIGVVLSGTGNDGTEGLKTIKAEGGITFAQDPETAQYPDMPRNAIFAEAAYFVLSPENMAKEIVRLSKNPQLTRIETESPPQNKDETSLRKILTMLKIAFGVDFTHYKETTINRRISRRMVINKIENNTEYVAFLLANPNELNALFDDLLIGVTSFFREPKTFDALREKVFPELIKNRSPQDSIRVWVPGCSTGEEVYSLAIAIQEFLESKTGANYKVQIFGTDANEKNIEKARQGLYPKTIEDKVSESRLNRFFNRQNGNYQITKLIRDMCIFAKQDITSDPPFSNLDLIMCRNVLIYFDSLLHERVFPIFHYGLKVNSFLVIGESESVGKFSYLFEPITTKGLIFRKKQTQPQNLLHSVPLIPYSPTQKIIKQSDKPNSMVLLKEEVDRLLISEYVPATLLVNNNLEILVFRGQADPYLTHESGSASFNLAKIIRKELRMDVQTAIYRARKENKAIKETVQFKDDGQQKVVTVKVNPLKTMDYEEPFFLITFEEASPHKYSQQVDETLSAPAKKDTVKDSQIQELREDLAATKKSLQTIIEVQEATNEELRSTMEEAQSSNEELQSTNEELETAKEELQSSNEELQTLNEELKNRNLALGRLNDDLTNLQTNTNISVVIVDNELKIRRFTASAQELLEILPSDIGRSITSINLGMHIVDLEKMITNVTTKLTTINQEVALSKNCLFEMQIRPYLTEEKKIGGAVLSFTDITERKKADEKLREYRENLEKLVEERTNQLQNSERLAAIGATAGMVGHDIRNPLQAIAGDLYLVDSDVASLSEGETKESLQESLRSIQSNLLYIGKIVEDLQDFARPQKPNYEKIRIEKVIEDVMLLMPVDSNHHVFIDIEQGFPIFAADFSMLKRVVNNLVHNALQAMPDGGRLTIQAYHKDKRVFITVEDTGIGIPDEVKAKLFTPLVTTKAKGQGLGLAVVKRLVEAQSGTVNFESKVGKGSKFTIELPMTN